MKDRLVIGSRGSQLALTQASLIKQKINSLYAGLIIEIEVIKTSGDVKTEPLSVIGGKGVFTKELEDALAGGRIDLAVHSLKDLPTIIPDELVIAAICEREDARDALVLRSDSGPTQSSLADLPQGAVVGTSSLRRQAQLKYLRPDVAIKDLRGNVDTRLRKLDEGKYDALLLAAAGLRRLGLESRISALISESEMLPAVGQGALALETRAIDDGVIGIATQLNHEQTQIACEAERGFLRALGGGCQLPIAGYATVTSGNVSLKGLVADREGLKVIRGEAKGPKGEPERVGSQLAQQLLKQGAMALLA